MDEVDQIDSYKLAEAKDQLAEIVKAVDETGVPVEIQHRGRKVYVVCDADFEDLEAFHDDELMDEIQELAAYTMEALAAKEEGNPEMLEELEDALGVRHDHSEDEESKVIAFSDIDGD